jgi:hypothetical protein
MGMESHSFMEDQLHMATHRLEDNLQELHALFSPHVSTCVTPKYGIVESHHTSLKPSHSF